MKRSRIVILIFIAVNALIMGRTPQEVRLAVRALSQRAATGDAKALYDLARLHDYGYDSIPVDTARSTALYRLSAMKGYAPAQSYLGFRYFTGEGIPLNSDSAIFWFEKAVDAGDPRAANNLAFLKLHGEPASRDTCEAMHLFEMAAVHGLITAKSQLADFYRFGICAVADTLKAISLYLEAAKGGLADADMKLLSMMKDTWSTLPPDSALLLGREFYRGEAPLSGVCLLNAAADDGNADAMTLLGEAYSLGRGVDYNHKESQRQYLKGALGGSEEAARVIAELIEIFPESLGEEHLRSIIDEFYQDKTVPEEIYTPKYWYDKARGR